MGIDPQPSANIPSPQGLEHCEGCGRPFVVPVALLDLIDEGLYLLELHCKNCDRLSVGVHEDAELERFEFHERAAAERLAAAVHGLDASHFADELDRFTHAIDPREAA